MGSCIGVDVVGLDWMLDIGVDAGLETGLDNNGCWTGVTGYWMLETGCWMLETGYIAWS